MDIQKYKFYVISRLLEFGDFKACRFVLVNFSRKDILKVIKKSRQISKKQEIFGDFIFDFYMDLSVLSSKSKKFFLWLKGKTFIKKFYLADGGT